MANTVVTTPPVGSHVDINSVNCIVDEVNLDESWILVHAPIGDGTNDMQFWIPINTGQFTVSQALPTSWPPKPNDMWIVPGVSQPAMVVDGGGGTLFFTQGSDVMALYNSKGKVIPMTTDAALGEFGTALTLLYRPPAS